MLVILFQTLSYVQFPGFDLTVVGEEFLLTQTGVGWKANYDPTKEQG